MSRLGALAACAVTCIAVGCQRQQSFAELEPGFERMLQQPRVDPFQSSTFYRDRMAMRPLLAGTVPAERKIVDTKVALGLDHGVYVERVPIAVDRKTLRHGRERFEIFCAPCHGFAGDGESVVADFMNLRKPPSLHDARLRAYPAGRLYHVTRFGYGLMPSYAGILSDEDRWSVVAYVRALQLSRNVRASTLPREVRAELDEKAP